MKATDSKFKRKCQNMCYRVE